MVKVKYIPVLKIERVLFWISLLIFLFLLAIGAIRSFTEELLGTVKTITLLQYSCFIFFTFLLEEFIRKYRKWFTYYKSVLLKFAFMFVMALSYEVLWIFFFWFSNYNFYGINVNIDTIEHEPSQKLWELFSQPINLNFISKITILTFFLSLYFFYRVSKLSDRK